MGHAVEMRELLAFLTLCEEFHFGPAAERLVINRSRVSQIISGLEDKVGGRGSPCMSTPGAAAATAATANRGRSSAKSKTSPPSLPRPARRRFCSVTHRAARSSSRPPRGGCPPAGWSHTSRRTRPAQAQPLPPSWTRCSPPDKRGEAVERFLSLFTPPHVVEQMKSGPYWTQMQCRRHAALRGPAVQRRAPAERAPGFSHRARPGAGRRHQPKPGRPTPQDVSQRRFREGAGGCSKDRATAPATTSSLRSWRSSSHRRNRAAADGTSGDSLGAGEHVANMTSSFQWHADGSTPWARRDAGRFRPRGAVRRCRPSG
jgi:hypothetical protein